MNNADIESPRPERLETSFRIFIDQAGYLPNAEKTAVFTFSAGYYLSLIHISEPTRH